jgi:predicted lactoylglutathione lyase
MPKMIFVNLPVNDLAAATRFYEAIGCKKNEHQVHARADIGLAAGSIGGLANRIHLFAAVEGHGE